MARNEQRAAEVGSAKKIVELRLKQPVPGVITQSRNERVSLDGDWEASLDVLADLDIKPSSMTRHLANQQKKYLARHQSPSRAPHSTLNIAQTQISHDYFSSPDVSRQENKHKYGSVMFSPVQKASRKLPPLTVNKARISQIKKSFMEKSITRA